MSLLDVVGVVDGSSGPTAWLSGQVGTIVEQLDDKSFLVEFSDDHGRACAVAPCREVDLLVLHDVPEAA